MTAVDEHTDRTGHPLRPGYYVRHEAQNHLLPDRQTVFRGVVIGFQEDHKGVLVELLEWFNGGPSGNRLSRPEFLTVRPPPASLKEHREHLAATIRRREALAAKPTPKKANLARRSA